MLTFLNPHADIPPHGNSMAEARESWELICGDRHEFDLEKEDLIASCLNAKLDSARDKDERNAL